MLFCYIYVINFMFMVILFIIKICRCFRYSMNYIVLYRLGHFFLSTHYFNRIRGLLTNYYIFSNPFLFHIISFWHLVHFANNNISSIKVRATYFYFISFLYYILKLSTFFLVISTYVLIIKKYLNGSDIIGEAINYNTRCRTHRLPWQLCWVNYWWMYYWIKHLTRTYNIS